MNNKVLAIAIVTTLLLPGCLGSGENDEPTTEGDNLDDWDVFYVSSGTDLPNCNSETLGRLYYVAESEAFEVCLTSGWAFIEIVGPQGEQGQAGPQGEQGQAGSDGQDIDPSLVAQLQAENTALSETIASLESDLINATTCQLVPFGNCAGADLSGMDLSGMDLTGIDLRSANLEGTNLSGAGLNESLLMNIETNRNTSFSNAYLVYTDLTDADLGLYAADLTDDNAHLRHADLTGANLRYADLTGANLGYADLTGADLYAADLTDADLYAANLKFADFEDAIVTDADFSGNYWHQTIWTNGIRYDTNQA